MILHHGVSTASQIVQTIWSKAETWFGVELGKSDGRGKNDPSLLFYPRGFIFQEREKSSHEVGDIRSGIWHT
ncbi:MAG TPA: hypothetical protein VI981_01320 [Candidatus Paceibacterota bacterium]